MNRDAAIKYSRDWYHKNKVLKGPAKPPAIALRIIERLKNGERQADIARAEKTSATRVLYWRKKAKLSGPVAIDPVDVVGARVGWLQVTHYVGKPGKYHLYACRCVCGVRIVVLRQRINGKNKALSCGCKRQRLIGELSASFKHGKTNTSIYSRWSSMRRRCYKKTDPKYPRYGGRGIAVCKRWQDFGLFFKDMGHPPTAAHSIDRIDVNGPYSPDNCRWATQKVQQNNRRNTTLIKIDGITKPLTQWAEEHKIKPRLFRQRMERDKLSPKEALRPR